MLQLCNPILPVLDIKVRECVRAGWWIEILPVGADHPGVMVQIQPHALNTLGGLWLQVRVLHKQIRRAWPLQGIDARGRGMPSVHFPVDDEVGVLMFRVSAYEDP